MISDGKSKVAVRAKDESTIETHNPSNKKEKKEKKKKKKKRKKSEL